MKNKTSATPNAKLSTRDKKAIKLGQAYGLGAKESVRLLSQGIPSDQVAPPPSVKGHVISARARRLLEQAENQIKDYALFNIGNEGIRSDPASEVLQGLHENFPLNRAGMGPDFKGTHSITMDTDGNPVVNICWCGKVWPITFK